MGEVASRPSGRPAVGVTCRCPAGLPQVRQREDGIGHRLALIHRSLGVERASQTRRAGQRAWSVTAEEERSGFDPQVTGHREVVEGAHCLRA